MTTLDQVLTHSSETPNWIKAIVTRFRNWQARNEIRQLKETDERLLKDMGLTREEVLWASRLPLSLNAAHELRHESRSRRLAEDSIKSAS